MMMMVTVVAMMTSMTVEEVWGQETGTIIVITVGGVGVVTVTVISRQNRDCVGTRGPRLAVAER